MLKLNSTIMNIRNEVKQEKVKIDLKRVESNAKKPMPSIWYT